MSSLQYEDLLLTSFQNLQVLLNFDFTYFTEYENDILQHASGRCKCNDIAQY